MITKCLTEKTWTSLALAAAATALVATAFALQPHSEKDSQADPTQAAPASTFPVEIRHPDGPPMVDTGVTDEHGRPVLANCTTCHTTKAPNPRIADGSELKDFHQGLVTQHGGRTCLSCHNPEDYNTLKLADGKPLPYAQVMTLCAQCHGPQYRDYQHGSHGGMNGYWDLTQGPRTRNNCIDCHDPHAPQYPTFRPVLPPNDRFLRPAHSENAHE
ncbi:MAG: hypothetical protein Kow00105_08760 [Phycisphaeraceae bacterium]